MNVPRPRSARARQRLVRQPERVAMLVGVGLGGAVAALGSIGVAEALLLVAPLVAFPLVWGIPRLRTGLEMPVRVWSGLERAGFPAAWALVASFALAPGWTAAALAAPWALVLVAHGGVGAWRVLRRGRRPRAEELGVDAALLLAPIGGAWLVASRAGLEPFGFAEPIVLLTAAHFHWAGLVLPLVVGLAAAEARGAHARWTVAGVASGVPLVAVGIQLGAAGWLAAEACAALWLCAFTWSASLLLGRVAARSDDTLDRVLLTLAASSLAFAMVFAAVYALGRAAGRAWLDVPTMIVSHAVLNVVGFGLPALARWRRLPVG